MKSATEMLAIFVTDCYHPVMCGTHWRYVYMEQWFCLLLLWFLAAAVLL